MAFKIDRSLCEENNLIENNGIKSNIKDVTIDSSILRFRKKYKFLYKFKIVSKIERLFIKLFYQNKSRKLKNFFN